MAWNELLHGADSPAEMPDAMATADEVGDELMFHFRKLVDEKLATGLSFDDAWMQAEKQFGPMRRYDYECRRGQLAQRRKRRWLAVTVVLAVVCIAGWSVFETRREKQQDARRISGGFDLTGTIVDDSNQPLENATLLIIRKTWPGGDIGRKRSRP
ncbi:MAG TPA: hypothetical protein VGH74_15665 [Planctomycetaceae bacterium]|jgi:hypothetical protein